VEGKYKDSNFHTVKVCKLPDWWWYRSWVIVLRLTILKIEGERWKGLANI
jgi:hypothetical protein